jgi:hypothetical protein
MAYPDPADASLPSLPSEPDPLVTYLVRSIIDLLSHADSLFSRYRVAGTKYHSMPFAVRASTHLQYDMISMLDEVYSLTTDSRLPNCVADTFSDLIWCVAEASRALTGDDEDVGAADNFVFNAFSLAEKLEKCVYATEAAVADVMAIRNSLMEQGLVQAPDPLAFTAFLCFAEWAKALDEWTDEMAAMTNDILSNPSGVGMQGISGYGGG